MANVHPRRLGAELSGLNRSPVITADGARASETTGGLGALLHAARSLGPAHSEESNVPSAPGSGLVDSALIDMSRLSDEGSTPSSDLEASGKQDFGESQPEEN